MTHSGGADESPRALYVNDDAFADLARTKLDRIAGDITLSIETDAESVLARHTTGEIDCIVAAYSLSETTGNHEPGDACERFRVRPASEPRGELRGVRPVDGPNRYGDRRVRWWERT